MKEVKKTDINEKALNELLGIGSSKLGYYTEVKQAINDLEAVNEGLRRKQRELEVVFNAIGDSVVIYDHFGAVQYRNHVCRKVFPRETIIGKSFHELCKLNQEEQSPIEKALHHGESTLFSFSIANPDTGTLKHFDATVTTIPEQLDSPTHGQRALVLIRDITERRLREAQLLQSEKMYSIGLLAAGVAHEINNPMTSVAGYAEALQRRFREDKTLAGDQRLMDFPKYLDVIIREVYRCKSIINSLQSFSRKSDGNFQSINLNKSIKDVVELARHTWKEKQIIIKTSMCQPSPQILGDPSAIHQIFLNLVLNAIQAIETDGTVTIGSHVEAENAVITIADTGCGISPENLREIWTPFFTTKKVGSGQGLGLAITYDMVEKHQGSISVNSTVGQGTEFTIKLPTA